MQTIAIVGGGFSGTMTAVNLSRMCDHSLRVVIVNSLRPVGRGTAYGTTRSEHLLNVAARNMSALPDFPLISSTGCDHEASFVRRPIPNSGKCLFPDAFMATTCRAS